MLQVNELVAGYGKVVALHGVTLSVQEGKVVTVLGPNGSGKSTILKCIIGLIPVLGGNILFRGERISGLRCNRIVRKGIAVVPEGRQVFPELNVQENLRIGAYARKQRSGMDSGYERVFTIFPVLKTRLKQLGGTLSGGEQQMLAIGRALMSGSRFIIMDEPSLGLAPLIVEQIFDIVKKINAEGVTILLVEQNVNMALRISDYGLLLESGKIVLSGSRQTLVENEQIQRSFLGA